MGTSLTELQTIARAAKQEEQIRKKQHLSAEEYGALKEELFGTLKVLLEEHNPVQE